MTLNILKETLKEILKANDIKPGTRKAGDCEYFFLQGALTADSTLANDPILMICLMSGRSILTLGN